MNILIRRFEKLSQYASRPWYLPFASVLAALDLFLLFIPTDFLVVSSSALQPRKWFSFFAWITTGSAIGALVLVLLLRIYGLPFIESLGVSTMNPASWPSVIHLIQEYGSVALGLIAFGPLPLQPA